MKNLFTLLVISLFAKVACSQGIHFEEGSWERTVAMAKQQNKPIFIDVYTAWCGPCKVMAKHIFPEKHVGDKFNSGFINYKIDAEKGEGVALAKRYEVRAYPTFLIIDPKNQTLIHKEVGALSINDFMAMGDMALQKGGYTNKGKSLREFEVAYGRGERSPDFLVAFMQQNALEKKDNRQLADTLFAYLTENQRLQQPYIGYLALNVSRVASPLFGFLASQHESVRKAINPGDQLFFESAMIDATRSVSAYKGKPDVAIVKNMKDFCGIISSKQAMVESYYYSPLGRYFKNTKDSTGFISMARDYGKSIIFKTTKEQLQQIDQAAIADVQAKLNSGEVDSAYFKAKTRNPNANREQASIRIANLAFDVARIARSDNDKQFAIKLIHKAIAIYPTDNNSIMFAAILRLTGDDIAAKKALGKIIASNPKEEAQLVKRFESLATAKF